MSGKKKTNGDEQCKCRFSSLSPHRKKKCALFGKSGFLVEPDKHIQHAKALDKEIEEPDQSPEAVRARIEKAVEEAAGPGVKVNVTVTIETAAQPPTPPADGDAGTSTGADPVSPQPGPTADVDAQAGMAGLTLDGGTQVSISLCSTFIVDLLQSHSFVHAFSQYDEHDTYTNSPLADTEDDLLGGFNFERSVPAANNTTDASNTGTYNHQGEEDDDAEDIEYEEARRSGADANDSILGGLIFDFVRTVPAGEEEEGEGDHDTVIQI